MHCRKLTLSFAAVQAQPVATDTAPKKGSVQKWENGFEIERLHVGKPDGKLAKPGKKVIVKYKGTLSSGKVFDETKGNKTFSFRLGGPCTTVLVSCAVLGNFLFGIGQVVGVIWSTAFYELLYGHKVSFNASLSSYLC